VIASTQEFVLQQFSRIRELDGLRALAICLVIGCHYKAFALLFSGVPGYGWIGVDIFFVISGFIITSILYKMRASHAPYKTFYVRRILRIFPIYYLTFFIIVAISALCHEHLVNANALVKNSIFLQSFVFTPPIVHVIGATLRGAQSLPSLLHPQDLSLAAAGYDTSTWAGSFSHTWSLSVEEYFYIFWAPIVLQLRAKTIIRVAIFIFLLAPLTRFVGFDGLRNYFEFFSRIDMLMAGSILSLVMMRRSESSRESISRIDKLFVIAAVGSLLMVGFIFLLRWPFLGEEIRDDALFMTLGLTGLCIVFTSSIAWLLRNAESSNPICQLLRSSPFQFLGGISYCLYIIHVPIYVAFSKLARVTGYSGSLIDLAIALASTAVSIGLAKVSWIYIETPFLSLKDRLAPSVHIVSSFVEPTALHDETSPQPAFDTGRSGASSD
jgi:peptidoglycan/LPS O-acetylase OafA/YrhL